MKTIRNMFVSAAVFNWIVGILLFAFTNELFALLRISPQFDEPFFIHLFASLVFVFGIGYYWISKNPSTNISLIQLGILGKSSVVAVILMDIPLGNISWQIMLVGVADLIYAVLFFRALVYLQSQQSRNSS